MNITWTRSTTKKTEVIAGCLLALALAGCGTAAGAATPSTSSAAPAPAATQTGPSGVRIPSRPLPPGTTIDCGNGVYIGPDTDSCGFAMSVYSSAYSSGLASSVTAYDGATDTDPVMTQTSTSPYYIYQGANGALVEWYAS